jgi:asparagine N-glycosylation enzyme membrane subunit Stt3
MGSIATTIAAPVPVGGSGRTTTLGILAILGLWLLGTLIATFFAAIQADSTVVGEMYIPRGNDSFYHARRILDAAVGERGFYQFDERLHPPEGTWIPWPWAYDYLLAELTKLALWLRPSMDAMAFLSYVPVAWIGVNTALFLGVTGAVGLSLPMRALAVLGFALSPLTQLLHSVAMIDHHFVELTFVLAITWLGIVWLQRPESPARAAALGALLGLAPAFHNGLFILQIIPLGVVFLLWLRNRAPPRAALYACATALLVVTQLILLPSAPYRSGLFSFGLLSWFQFYVACCTAVLLVLGGHWRYSAKHLAILAVVALALAMPLLTNLLQGAAFMSGRISILPDIMEAQSPFRFAGDTLTSSDGISHFGWLLFAAPALLVYFLWQLVRETRGPRLWFLVASCFGLAMLMLQFRFHYFGSLALIVGSLLVTEEQARRRGWHAGLVFVVSFGLLVLAYQPPLRERLFLIYAAGAEPAYQYSLGIHLKLAEVCADDPGLVLANNDDGSAILFHSDCSVIANNFILGPEDDAKFAEIVRLMRSSPDELLRAEPAIRYLFVRAENFGRRIDGALVLDPSSAIVTDLILGEDLPEGFELISAIDARTSPEAETEPYARLYRLTPQRQEL